MVSSPTPQQHEPQLDDEKKRQQGKDRPSEDRGIRTARHRENLLGGGPSGRDRTREPIGSTPGCVWLNYWAATGIERGWATGVFGRVTVSTPSTSFAWIVVRSTVSGIAKVRRKAPNRRSTR